MKMQVAVFFGGHSVEHEISIITGMQAIAALDRDKYDVVPIYISKDGSLYTGEQYDRLDSYKNIPELLENGRQVSLVRNGGRVTLQSTVKKIFGSEKPVTLDVGVPCVHGTFSEDGCLQGLLEMCGLPYTGCDVLSSAVCMDKPVSKALLRLSGLPVLEDAVLESHKYAQNPEVVLSALETHFPYPVIVKPANLGSSVGITKADSRDKLAAALDLAFSFASRAVIEPALIHMREINCAVLGDNMRARASVCEEPIAGDAILSYSDKYQGGGKQTGKQTGMSGQRRIIPAELPAEKSELVQRRAVEAFQQLGCSGVVRVDFLWDTRIDEFYVNELNTIPGSLAFYLWAESGLGFSALLDEMIELAYARARRRSQTTYSYESNILATAKLEQSKGG